MLFAAHKLSDKEMKKVKTLKHILRVNTNKELFLKLIKRMDDDLLSASA